MQRAHWGRGRIRYSETIRKITQKPYNFEYLVINQIHSNKCCHFSTHHYPKKRKIKEKFLKIVQYVGNAYLKLCTFKWQLQMVSVIFCWWVMCIALMETWIAWRSLHHMRLAIHHVAHCFWIRGRWSCVWSKNYLQKNKI